jgi:septation ring formation regulator EzrA
MLDKYLDKEEMNMQFNQSGRNISFDSRNDIYNTTKNLETSLEHIQKDIEEISDKFRQVDSSKSSGEDLTKIKYLNPDTKQEQSFDVRILIYLSNIFYFRRMILLLF